MVSKAWAMGALAIVLAGAAGPLAEGSGAPVLPPLSPALQPQGSGPAQVPCFDAIHCPDMTIDANRLRNYDTTWRYFQPTSCAVQEGYATEGLHRLLRTTIATPNIGTYDLVIGTPAQNPTLFEWGACHGHWHYIAYATMRLWTHEAYASYKALRVAFPSLTSNEIIGIFGDLLNPGLITSEKTGFCIINVASGYALRYPELYLPSGHRPTCSSMGVTAGWADVYGLGTEGQWLLIDGVLPGTYMLEAEVNADRLFNELEFEENTAAVEVTI